jgi:protein gp37
VALACTAENQAMADKRMPIFRDLPLHRRVVIVEPILGPMDLSRHLSGIHQVIVGGESGEQARTCNLRWVMDLQRQCRAAAVSFTFKQTGANFVDENGRRHSVARMHQLPLAKRYGLSFTVSDDKCKS